MPRASVGKDPDGGDLHRKAAEQEIQAQAISVTWKVAKRRRRREELHLFNRT